MIKSALLLPAHGHAPYLIGTRLLRNLAIDICIPEYYGEKQRDILRHEFPGATGRIFLSESMGRDLKPLLLGTEGRPKLVDSAGQDNSLDFDLYASDVDTHAESISSNLETMLQKGIEAIALDGTRKRFTQFDFTLNTGLPVYSPVRDAFYAFVGKMSEIYRLSPYQSPGIKSLTAKWKNIESSFNRNGMFIPRLHSLYERKDFDATGIRFTPPFAQPYPPNHDDTSRIPSGSILVIASGTGIDVPKLVQIMAASPGSYVTLEESPPEFDEYCGKDRVSSKAWGNPNIVAVLARSGLGSIWQAILNQKPVGVVAPDAKIDPEVFHNAQMVEKAGIGKILTENVAPLTDALPKYQSEIRRQLKEEVANFSTSDGIEYTSAALKELLSAVVAK